MANIRAFRGLRYNIEKVGGLDKVTTPPYDVISEKEQDMFYNLSPYSVIRLELNKETNEDNESDNRYTRSAKFLNEWINDGILEFEDEEALYLYEEIFELKSGEMKSFKGFMTLTELVEFSKKVVLPHEETLSKAKMDRFNLMNTSYSNFSPIYCLYMDPEKNLTKIINDVSKEKPLVSFKDSAGVIQNLWVIKDSNLIQNIKDGFSDKQLFIADGHHRYETALNFRNLMREKEQSYSGDELYNYVFMMLVEMDDPGLVVFPTHRLVYNIENFNEDNILEKLKEDFKVTKVNIDVKDELAGDMIEKTLSEKSDSHVFAMYTGKEFYYLLILKDVAVMKNALSNKSEAYCGLDVSILHSLVLDKVMGIDIENLANQTNLTYTKKWDEPITEVLNGNYQCSFMLNPTKVKQIKDVSLENEKMPQKSTYFYPKIITGLVMNKFR